MKKLYRLWLHLEKNSDVIEILEQIPQPLRGQFIVDAIRYYLANIRKGIINASSSFQKEEKEEEKFKVSLPKVDKPNETNILSNAVSDEKSKKVSLQDKETEKKEQKTPKIDLSKIIGGF